MLKNRKTDTTIFLLPVLAINKQELELCGFQDAYIKVDDPQLDFKDCLFLLFKSDSDKLIEDFHARESERTDVFLKKYKDFTILAYKFPDEFIKDRDLVIKGEYSKTSQQFQNMFTKYKKRGGNIIPTLQHLVFTKDEGLREQWAERLGSELEDNSEVWGAFNIEDNTLKINNIC